MNFNGFPMNFNGVNALGGGLKGQINGFNGL
jgi:hypothetical protein